MSLIENVDKLTHSLDTLGKCVKALGYTVKAHKLARHSVLIYKTNPSLARRLIDQANEYQKLSREAMANESHN